MRGIAKSGQSPNTLHGAVRTRRVAGIWKPGTQRIPDDPQVIPARLRAVRLHRTRTRRTYLRRDRLIVVLLLIGIGLLVVFGEVFR